MSYQGDYAVGATVIVDFSTFDSNDPSASVTITGLAVTDIEIFKDGGATTRSSDNGYALLDTDGIDVAGITGIHGFSIDTSNDTDSGFFAAGSDYKVVVASVTVDGATVNFVAATFSIENRSTGTAAGVSLAADIAAMKTVVDAIPTTAMRGTDIGNLNDVSTADLAAALVAIGLDHLVAVAVADEVVDNSIIAKLVSSEATANWSSYVWTTEALQAIRDQLAVVDGIVDNILVDTGTTLDNLVDDLETRIPDVISLNAIWGRIVETNNSITAEQVLRVALAVLAGVTSSDGAVFEDPSGTTTRVTATIDSSQNRTGITLNL